VNFHVIAFAGYGVDAAAVSDSLTTPDFVSGFEKAMKVCVRERGRSRQGGREAGRQGGREGPQTCTPNPKLTPNAHTRSKGTR